MSDEENKEVEDERPEMVIERKLESGEPMTHEEMAAANDSYEFHEFSPNQLETFYTEHYATHMPHYDDKDWKRVSEGEEETIEQEMLRQARWVARYVPHCKRALDLYDYFVFGSSFNIGLEPISFEDPVDIPEATIKKNKKIVKQAAHVWKTFIQHNFKWWSPHELGKRAWRDGEAFSVKWTKESEYPPELRFIDREKIGEPLADEKYVDTQGILTKDGDVNTILGYLNIDSDGVLLETLDPSTIYHTKIDVDSTEKRGRTRFESVLDTVKMYDALVKNEVTLRNAQSSIVMVRRIQGTRSAYNKGFSNSTTGVKTYATQSGTRTVDQEQWKAGTVLTVGQGVDVEFVQPNNNFSDASPLAKLLTQQVASATGWSYTMLSTDSSSGSFSSELLSETPVLAMVLSEQKFFSQYLYEIYRWVLTTAIQHGKIKSAGKLSTFWDRYEPIGEFGNSAVRDKLKENQSINVSVINETISKEEGSRMQGKDPDKMKKEIEAGKLREQELFGEVEDSTNPDIAAKKASTVANATGGSGGNQGSGDPITHKDAVT